MSTTTLTCATCDHPNGTHRGFCAKCGNQIQLVCRGCRFINGTSDRFCGGCGIYLPGAELRVQPAPAVAPTREAFAADELHDLFAPAPAAAAEPELPSAGITQSDLDRLFGAAK